MRADPQLSRQRWLNRLDYLLGPGQPIKFPKPYYLSVRDDLADGTWSYVATDVTEGAKSDSGPAPSSPAPSAPQAAPAAPHPFSGNDPSSGELLLKRLLASDDPREIAAVGVMFFDGVSVPIDKATATPYLEEAAKLGRPEAQYRLGRLVEAAASSAALLESDPAAMTVMGNLKRMGQGGMAPDWNGGMALLEKAAKLGYPEAQTILSKRTQRGRWAAGRSEEAERGDRLV
jgi:TPR repeat protein